MCIIVSIIMFWIGCGILAYGITLAHFQNKFKQIAEKYYTSDVVFALFVALAGPIGLITSIIASNGIKHGIRFR